MGNGHSIGLLDPVEDAKMSGYFDRWLSKDALQKESSPLELLILGALRYLGRGFTFDDMEDAKVSVNGREIRFSDWLESMRKDVECTSGF
jgi:hypothetical protein